MQRSRLAACRCSQQAQAAAAQQQQRRWQQLLVRSFAPLMDPGALCVLSRVMECGALLFIGYQLRAAQLFSVTDAEVRLRPGARLAEAARQPCVSNRS